MRMTASEDDLISAIPDGQLLRRFQEGDLASFEALFARHYDLVYGVLFRLTGARAEAEDLLQEVFLRLYERPAAHGENVAGWLYRVALNTGYNALRSHSRREHRERRALSGETNSMPGPEDEVTLREAAGAARKRVQLSGNGRDHRGGRGINRNAAGTRSGGVCKRV